MVSPAKFYQVSEIICEVWSCNKNLATLAFQEEKLLKLQFHFQRIWPKKGQSCVKFNNLGPALGVALNFYNIVKDG